MLNELWKVGQLGKNWEFVKICPIFKQGNEEDVSNYRGISLLYMGYKILASVMAERLGSWCENENKLSESQAGFRKNRATRDHIFVLNTIIGNKIRHKKGKLYAVFVNFKAAFDSVNRNILFRKLWKVVDYIIGRMLKMFQAIYKETKNCLYNDE